MPELHTDSLTELDSDAAEALLTWAGDQCAEWDESKEMAMRGVMRNLRNLMERHNGRAVLPRARVRHIVAGLGLVWQADMPRPAQSWRGQLIRAARSDEPEPVRVKTMLALLDELRPSA